MINKIIYMMPLKVNERDYKRHGMGIMKDNGFEVEIWDLSELMYKYYDVFDALDYQDNNIVVWHSKAAVENAISLLDDTVLIISTIPLSYPWIFSALQSNNLPYAVLWSGYIPIFVAKEDRITKQIIRMKKVLYNPKKIVESLKKRIINKNISKKIYPAQYILTPSLTIPADFSIAQTTKKIYSHSFDYNLYLEGENRRPSSDFPEKYFVFIDEWVPFHMDYKISGIKSYVLPEKADDYYGALNVLFGRLEAKYKIPVIIAAHPRSGYHVSPYKEADYYRGRQIYLNRTQELIRSCEAVIMHYSTSISYAIIYKKPIIFTVTENTKKTALGVLSRGIADYLKSQFLIADGSCNEFSLQVNQELYDKYRNSYIKVPGTPEINSIQMLADIIKEEGQGE